MHNYCLWNVKVFHLIVTNISVDILFFLNIIMLITTSIWPKYPFTFTYKTFLYTNNINTKYFVHKDPIK
jgi:hypothetical protein